MSSCSAWRWVTSAMGPPSATAALSALTLFSRPTWSGTIISGKMTVSRRATRGSSRGTGGRSRRRCSSTGVDGRLAIVVLLRFGSVGGSAPRRLVDRRRSVNGRPSIGRGRVRSVRALAASASERCVAGAFGVERLEDPGAEALLELEQDADAGEVHAALPGEVADPEDPPDVVLAVEPDVGRRPGRAEQALVLVDPQRSRMRADDARRHADDVDGPLGIAVRTG